MGKRNADTSLHNANSQKKCKLDETLNDSNASENEFVLTKEIVVGTVLTDINHKQWRVGKPIGKCLNKVFSVMFSNLNVFWLKVKAVLVRYFWHRT